MDSIIVSGIIAAVAALTGSLGAILIGSRHALRLERMREASSRRENARKLGAEILLTAGKLTMMLSVIVSMAKPLQQAARQSPAVIEELMDQVEPLQASAMTLAEASMQFSLTFNERDLAAMARTIGKGADEIGVAFAVFAALFASTQDLPESAVPDFMAKATRLGQNLRAFEEVLISRLSEPLPASG